jgi:hypothetical protein
MAVTAPLLRALRVGALVVLATSGIGCGETPRTEVLLVVDSNVTRLDDVQVTTVAPDGTASMTATALLGPGEPPLPRTVGLAHDGESALGPARVEIAGRESGDEVVRRTVRFWFREEETLVLRIELTRNCMEVTCTGDLTCEDGRCRRIDLEPAELVTWDGTAPGSSSSDAGP